MCRRCPRRAMRAAGEREGRRQRVAAAIPGARSGAVWRKKGVVASFLPREKIPTSGRSLASDRAWIQGVASEVTTQLSTLIYIPHQPPTIRYFGSADSRRGARNAEVIETGVSEFIHSSSARATPRPLRFGYATHSPEKLGRCECEPSDRISRSFERSPCPRTLRPSRRESAIGAARNACAAPVPARALTPTPRFEHRHSAKPMSRNRALSLHARFECYAQPPRS